MSSNCNYDCFNCKLPECIDNRTSRQETMYRYNHSDKGKTRAVRYNNSPKGKERSRRASQKDIESGKNAERCRKYYWRKKGIEID